MRTPLIAGNWKLNKTQKESGDFAELLVKELGEVKGVEVAIIPAFTSLSVVRDKVINTPIKFGAQNMHWEKSGAYTGEISTDMLLEINCDFVLIGHSERREYFKETDETVNKKIKAALRAGLDVIFCVGEKLEQRESGEHENVVGNQLEKGLVDITAEEMKKIIIAYEPVWAIGTGKTATPEDANSMHGFIRNKTKALFNDETADAVRILYGGSVKPENTASLIQQEHIDGALVGGAALKVESFVGIIRAI